LITGNEHLIVVDTGDNLYRQRLIGAIYAHGHRPEEVDLVVNTHLHYDHCSNNDIFPEAKVIAHALEGAVGDFILMQGDLMMVEDGIRLVHTPGHTPGAISAFVEADRRVVVAGDAIPTYENVRKWVPPGVVTDPVAALQSMERILQWAEVVVPGHGGPFDVSH
jgi:glyoxylase-like metal-dependent hydrolase (beta-lactamase superfamily II)